MRQRNLARPGRVAATHQRGGAGAVVRRAKGPLAPVLGPKAPGQRSHRRRFQRLLVVQSRQDAGQALRQHRLARARRAAHEQAVRARCGDLERPPRPGLALYIGQIGQVEGLHRRRALQQGPAIGVRGLGQRRTGGRKALHHIEQMVRPVHARLAHQGGFFGAARRQHQSGAWRLPRAMAAQKSQAHAQRTPDRAQGAAERELAGKFVAGQRGAVDLAAGGQNAERNRQIEAPRLFGQIGRRQVDCDALVVRPIEPGVQNGRAHPLARLLHLGIGQPHQRQAGQAVGQMHFHAHRQGV